VAPSFAPSLGLSIAASVAASVAASMSPGGVSTGASTSSPIVRHTLCTHVVPPGHSPLGPHVGLSNVGLKQAVKATAASATSRVTATSP